MALYVLFVAVLLFIILTWLLLFFMCYVQAPAPAATAEKVLKKTNAKGSVQKGKILEVVKEVPLDPIAEKLRQERYGRKKKTAEVALQH
ncbi:hypothetical protein HYC85_012883 [Camellia sinensis]|uniref:Uncharacterized protein n=1 Tax=Camellia sinensis TaxID=4442 RepID=A0A7J7HD91_CAMSI|nr:hypothetical protein HYC85_012883 [Camellia sinensis]